VSIQHLAEAPRGSFVEMVKNIEKDFE
jgi:hypothetical protein